MKSNSSKTNLAFVVSTLSEVAAQNEAVVELLLFAAAQLEQAISLNPTQPISATIITVEPDISGWSNVSALFPKELLNKVTVERLKEPVTPNLAVAGHKPAYNFYEFLKDRAFNEVHCIDRCGVVYYPTLAKQLGLYFLDTLFVVHVTGGTVFHKEVEDNLLDDVNALMDDLLERGSLERADAIVVHDHLAWQWYLDKIELRSEVSIHEWAWDQAQPLAIEAGPAKKSPSLSIIYYGPLSADGGLPLFCDAIGRALPELKQAVEVVFVGPPQAVGGMDAVSYIHLRSAKWNIPVTIKRDLAISDEIEFIFGLSGVVVCNTVRRENLRARLIKNSGLSVIHVKYRQDTHVKGDGPTYTANPGSIAQGIISAFQTLPDSRSPVSPTLLKLWQTGCPPLPALDEIPSSPPLRVDTLTGPKVSVCITHFSRPKALRRALTSLKQQTYKNFEVLVVDDGSPDPQVQQELAAIKAEIEPLGWRLLVQDNRYLGAARNFGARHLTGDYLLFMDDDNVAKPHEISTLVAVAHRTGAEIVTTFCDVFEVEDTLSGAEPPPLRYTPFGPDPALGVLSNCYGDANALYERQAFDKLGGFTEDYGITHEDWELFCRASIVGVKMVCVPEPLFWYRVSLGGMFRGEQTQLHKSANLRRHIRPYLEQLPYYQAKLIQLAQGLSTDLPVTPVGPETRGAGPPQLRAGHEQLPYARVAIITRTKDRPVLLRRAIRSALDQTFQDWLMIIVNDGGDPAIVKFVVDEVAGEVNGRILTVHHPVSMGMQTASNAGINSCDSDFIVIHDDDDSWEPNFLARTVSHLDRHGWNPKLGGVTTWSNLIIEHIDDENNIVTHNNYIFNDQLYNLSLVDLAIENRFPPISFIFRRAALEAIGPYREQYGVLGDWDFHLRVLQRFNIDVIPEPLANYHHRTNTTTGAYGNSVHAQNSIHRAKRAEFVNDLVRGQGEPAGSVPLAQLLTMGEMQAALFNRQQQEFQNLHNYMWTIEQQIKQISVRVEGNTVREPLRNLARNGDFRLWPGPSEAVKDPSNSYAYAEICPGFVICYDGRRVSYTVERRKWLEDGLKLPFGKNYLHIKNDGYTKGSSWFNLECTIPEVLSFSGNTIVVSMICRLKSPRNWIIASGRFEVGDGKQVAWPEQVVSITREFQRLTFTVKCPAVQKEELKRGHQARIILKLPHDQPFELDLADFQIELGTRPSEFIYNGQFSLQERASMVLKKAKKSWKKLRMLPLPFNSALPQEVDVEYTS
ncbi:MAG: glycosyltransferase [Anaerolineales bacterium]|nr:glycosyltransferase [Anaerolineales bacterium]